MHRQTSFLIVHPLNEKNGRFIISNPIKNISVLHFADGDVFCELVNTLNAEFLGDARDFLVGASLGDLVFVSRFQCVVNLEVELDFRLCA